MVSTGAVFFLAIKNKFVIYSIILVRGGHSGIDGNPVSRQGQWKMVTMEGRKEKESPRPIRMGQLESLGSWVLLLHPLKLTQPRQVDHPKGKRSYSNHPFSGAMSC